MKRLAQDPRTHEEAQATFGKWYIRTMNIFGRPGSAKNALYRKYRLKLRDNDEVRRAFAAEVKDKAEAFGLAVPEWTPVVGASAGRGPDSRLTRAHTPGIAGQEGRVT